MDSPRLPITEMHLGKFPDSMEFQSWKKNFKNEVCTRTVSPQITMLWINSKVNWRTHDIAIECGANRFPWLRNARCDDCVYIEKASRQAHSLPKKSKCRRAACSKIQPNLTRKTHGLHDLRAFPCNRSYEDGIKLYYQQAVCLQMWYKKHCTSRSWEILFNFRLWWHCTIKNGATQETELSQIEDSCETSYWSDDENSKLQSLERCCGKGISDQESNGKKACVARKVGEYFQWKAHGQCSKGDSCSFSHDKLLQGDLNGGQKRKRRPSSPTPNSKAKTDEGEKILKNIRRQSGKLFKQEEQDSMPLQKTVKTNRRVHFGILPCVKTTSLRLDNFF